MSWLVNSSPHQPKGCAARIDRSENKTVKLFYLGKTLEDSKIVKDYSNAYSELEDNCFVHAAVVNQSPPPPVIEPMVEVREEEPFEQPQDEGTNTDLILGIILGFFFHVLVFLCVSFRQILMGRLNKRQKYGCLIGIVLYVWAAVTWGQRDN